MVRQILRSSDNDSVNTWPVITRDLDEFRYSQWAALCEGSDHGGFGRISEEVTPRGNCSLGQRILLSARRTAEEMSDAISSLGDSPENQVLT